LICVLNTENKAKNNSISPTNIANGVTQGLFSVGTEKLLGEGLEFFILAVFFVGLPKIENPVFFVLFFGALMILELVTGGLEFPRGSRLLNVGMFLEALFTATFAIFEAFMNIFAAAFTAPVTADVAALTAPTTSAGTTAEFISSNGECQNYPRL
jgi:hypothetical protein